jgi:hypothetical protein
MSGDVRMGIYRHYKGPLYQVLGLAHDANADAFCNGIEEEMFPDGRTVVVYIGLQLDAAHLGPRLAVRTLEDFTAWVDVQEPTSTREAPVNGIAQRRLWMAEFRPRFAYLGPELTAEMLL